MKILTKSKFLDKIEEVWCDDVTGVVTMIRFLNHYIDENDEDIDEELFYDNHIDYNGITKQTLLDLVEEWDIGCFTTKTLVEFLDNYVESRDFENKIKR